MNTINNVSNSSIWSIQGNNAASNTQGQTKVHHHHHHEKTEGQDSVQISDDSKTEASSSAKSPLDSLVANGTITQDQEDSIKNAFLSARQANVTGGTYGSKPTNPISSLVTNGTITQSQADSITSAFKSRIQGNENNSQANGIQGHHGHHHHHQVQNNNESTPANSQQSNDNSSLNSNGDNLEAQTILAQTEQQE